MILHFEGLNSIFHFCCQSSNLYKSSWRSTVSSSQQIVPYNNSLSHSLSLFCGCRCFLAKSETVVHVSVTTDYCARNVLLQRSSTALCLSCLSPSPAWWFGTSWTAGSKLRASNVLNKWYRRTVPCCLYSYAPSNLLLVPSTVPPVPLFPCSLFHLIPLFPWFLCSPCSTVPPIPLLTVFPLLPFFLCSPQCPPCCPVALVTLLPLLPFTLVFPIPLVPLFLLFHFFSCSTCSPRSLVLVPPVPCLLSLSAPVPPVPQCSLFPLSSS